MSRTLTALAVHTYSGLLEAAVFCVAPLSPLWRAVRRLRLDERRRPLRAPGGAGASCVWVHAASLGEAKLLCRFVALLRERHRADRYLLTAMTASGVDYLRRQELDGVCGVELLPIDSLARMARVVSGFGVKRLWLMETEIWPAMLWACLRAGVPVGIVNGRLEERSVRRYRLFGALLRPLFASLDLVLAQDERYAGRFVDVGVPAGRVRVSGNLKGQVLIEAPSAQHRRQLRQRLGLGEAELVLTAGCLHPGEGVVVREALERLRSRGVSVRCVAVPRHRERAAAVAAELGPQTRVFADAAASEPWQVCLVDRYGILDDMYALADAALVGGTFADVGGHSMWDAARVGVPVLFGPVHHTQQLSCEQLSLAGVGFAVDDAAGLADALGRVLGPGRAAFEQARERFAAQLSANTSALARMLP